MGDRSSFGYYSNHGRASPLYTHFQDGPPRNLSGHFEYVGDDYDLSTRSPARLDDNDPDAPDRVHCRHLGTVHPLDFPAYSINEEKTTVRDLRKKIADWLNVDPRRVQLIYKGHELKHNSASLKRYGMKQNSEVSVVRTERLNDYDRGDTNSDEGSDRDANYSLHTSRQHRPRAHSTIRYRSDENVPMADSTASRSGAFLSPNGHVPAIPTDRHHRDSLRPDQAYSSRDDRTRGREREPSREPIRRHREPSPAARRAPSPAPAQRRAPSPAPQRRAHSPAPPPKQSPPPPAADPNSPLGKVQALASIFRTQWLPPSTKFLLSPPSDPAQRQKEYLKLSESIMSKIIIAADSIDIEGDAEARKQRKAMLNEANAVIKQLDELCKAKA